MTIVEIFLMWELQFINQYFYFVVGITKLNVHTDSKFMIKCITSWIHKWKRNSWKLSDGGPVKNKEELISLDKAIQNIECVKWVCIQYV